MHINLNPVSETILELFETIEHVELHIYISYYIISLS